MVWSSSTVRSYWQENWREERSFSRRIIGNDMTNSKWALGFARIPVQSWGHKSDGNDRYLESRSFAHPPDRQLSWISILANRYANAVSSTGSIKYDLLKGHFDTRTVSLRDLSAHCSVKRSCCATVIADEKFFMSHLIIKSIVGRFCGCTDLVACYAYNDCFEQKN